jgi:hypothetical protein
MQMSCPKYLLRERKWSAFKIEVSQGTSPEVTVTGKWAPLGAIGPNSFCCQAGNKERSGIQYRIFLMLETFL